MGYRALQEATQTRLPGVRARSRPGWCGRPIAKGG